ncbi:MAG: hypothetical protein ACRC4N_04715 [Gammaproteobacteria bacterium]
MDINEAAEKRAVCVCVCVCVCLRNIVVSVLHKRKLLTFHHVS